MAELDFVQRLRAWSYRRQGLDTSLPDPLAVLDRIVGVYSTNPSGALSLLARLPNLTPEDVLSLDKQGGAVRFPNMHGSTHLVPIDFAGAIHGATRVDPARFAPQLRTVGLDLNSYQALKPELLSQLQQPVDARSIKKTLGVGAAELLAIRTMARDLLVLRIANSVRTDQLAYVATEAWLGRPIESGDEARSLSQLAERYLRGFGPARIQDLAWWIPASQLRLRSALSWLDLIEVSPGYLLPADLEADFWSVALIDPYEIRILPKWDAWAMGYAPDGRGRMAKDAHLPFVYSTTETSANTASGDGWPIILRGGRAVARWESRFVGRRLDLTIMPFSGEQVAGSEIRDGFERIASFLGCADLNIFPENRDR